MKKILERIGFFFFFSLCGRFTTDIVRFFSLRWMDECIADDLQWSHANCGDDDDVESD